MELHLKRFIHKKESTVGYITEGGAFVCFSLEDQHQTKLVKGETRIPAGRYRVKFREVPSPLTMKYRKRYDWFTWHLELQNVPGRKYIYIHVGNLDEHTDGCILVGLSVNADEPSSGFDQEDSIGFSVKAYQKIYFKIRGKLNSGEAVFITVHDE